MQHQAQETFHGAVETVNEALAIIQAARTGVLPRIKRRLNETERRIIKSGSVFVWEEEESGIMRWTDGRCWSSSRVVGGHFIVYLEQPKGHSKKRFVSPELARTRLHKKVISMVTPDIKHFHLVAYYVPMDVDSGRLRPASSDRELASLRVPPNFFTPKLNSHHFLLPPTTGGQEPPAVFGDSFPIIKNELSLQSQRWNTCNESHRKPDFDSLRFAPEWSNRKCRLPSISSFLPPETLESIDSIKVRNSELPHDSITKRAFKIDHNTRRLPPLQVPGSRVAAISDQRDSKRSRLLPYSIHNHQNNQSTFSSRSISIATHYHTEPKRSRIHHQPRIMTTVPETTYQPTSRPQLFSKIVDKEGGSNHKYPFLFELPHRGPSM
ncbi:Gti1/Pac2 family-domain-containing protein [Paraphysoderma sedebokerense]|nr:Gti1/Pac2 family-domain-containing protein [Paraphysoderma sedebokerense]